MMIYYQQRWYLSVSLFFINNLEKVAISIHLPNGAQHVPTYTDASSHHHPTTIEHEQIDTEEP
jgi:hypothetical protein